MRKIITSTALLAIVILSCSKDTKKDSEETTAIEQSNLSARITSCDTCDVIGTYAGTATPNVGFTSDMIYELRENNFAVGTATIGGDGVTFGGYKTDCDSIYLSTHYGGNDSYYLLSGVFNGSHTVISGNFLNLTNTSDFGTFTMTKQ
jgi:hypothetical protein